MFYWTDPVSVHRDGHGRLRAFARRGVSALHGWCVVVLRAPVRDRQFAAIRATWIQFANVETEG